MPAGKGKGGGKGMRMYKMMKQKEGGFTLHDQQKDAVPQRANKVTHTEPGLGAHTMVHPFKSTKPTI